MQATAVVLFMLLAVIVSGFLARATRWPAPLVQIAFGAAIYSSGIGSVALEPQLFFLLFLPPLLFLDGWRIPKDRLFRDASTILKLALGLVLFTVLGMGLFIHWLLPAMPLSVAFALAAVISPTDPIAMSAIASRTPMPRRLAHILEGESLLNDASGLVAMRFAVAATLTGAFSLPAALADLAWVGLGGLAIGAALTWVVARLKAWFVLRFGDDGSGQVLATLLIPFGVYLLAERLHCSGILAAVAAGITMSFTEGDQWHGTRRIRRTAVWDTVQAAANGSIFVLLGEQLPPIVSAAADTVRHTGHAQPGWLGVYVLAIVAGLAGLRFAWVWVSVNVASFKARLRGEPHRAADWRLVMVMSLAGVRGAVTLAGVLTLPRVMNDGTPFPARDLAIFLAAGVIVTSLLVASVALPRMLRGLELPPEPSTRAAEDRVRKAAAEAALRAVEAAPPPAAADAGLQADLAAQLVAQYRQRIERFAAQADDPAQRARAGEIERRLRLAGLRAERDEILRRGRRLGLDDVALRKLVREIDLQEARYGG